MSQPSLIELVKVENYALSSILNASMLYNFLMGIYTIVYAGTLYVYLSKRSSSTGRWIVLTCISALYVFSVVNFILHWTFLSRVFIAHGDTKTSIFLASLVNPAWFDITDELCQGLPLVISDALLTWRCYHAWGQSVKIAAVLSLLCIAELALGIAYVVFQSTSASARAPHVGVNIETALAFISLLATSSATFLIGYRIRIVSDTLGGPVRQGRSSRAIRAKAYTRIVVTIVESSAVYAVALFMFALTTVVPVFRDAESPMSQAGLYIDAVLLIVAGLAPTVMVLRLALASANSNNAASSNTLSNVVGVEFYVSSHGGNTVGTGIGARRENSWPSPVEGCQIDYSPNDLEK
ncbi:hypothetical protein JR316_0009426 [Psilocybe cubensis]|uniref:Uncharacterized protein n=2 Tax=Psilocybe cubensis TaxID=181762 RepID=A0ACB8GTV7_PSICU|nr:hypothetical protein JR316_0009426 [Psilocybe cubensis]KAH9478963.1 hypothetical protein JR316_0009426 [Psilocybe cubensis]